MLFRWVQICAWLLQILQVLLSAILFLKYAYWAALAVFIAIWPTYYWGGRLKHDFERQYLDAGLLQTSKLDGWDTESSTSRTQREEYRRWLVDCHKASYVPVCLATSDCIITSEPCAVIPNSRDVEEFDRNGILTKQSTQRGALFRREKSNHSFWKAIFVLVWFGLQCIIMVNQDPCKKISSLR